MELFFKKGFDDYLCSLIDFDVGFRYWSLILELDARAFFEEATQELGIYRPWVPVGHVRSVHLIHPRACHHAYDQHFELPEPLPTIPIQATPCYPLSSPFSN